MAPRILIAYATRTGTTTGVVNAIQQELEANNFAVDVQRVDTVTSLEDYTAVIVGSSIRIGSWLPEAIRFLEDFKYELQAKPAAFFTVSITMAEDNAKNRQEVMKYMEKPIAIVKPVSVGLFGGAVNMQRLSFPLKMMVRVGNFPQGDFRDWNNIRRWTHVVIPKLLAKAPVV